MRLRSRELNIFSMSALDLFASALGAFILLAVIALPFFSNTHRLDDETLLTQIAEVRSQLASEVQRRQQAERRAEQLAGELDATRERMEEMQFPDLDLVIALDITGSMGEQIQGLKQDAGMLAALLSRFAPSVRIGIVAFGDRFYDNPITASDMFDVASGPGRRAYQAFVDSLELQMGIGGGSNPVWAEAVYLGLSRAIAVNWRAEARMRTVIVITDSYPYADEVEASIEAARRFATSGGTVSTVHVRAAQWPADNAQSQQYLQRLAEAGGGNFGPAGSSMITMILGAIM